MTTCESISTDNELSIEEKPKICDLCSQVFDPDGSHLCLTFENCSDSFIKEECHSETELQEFDVSASSKEICCTKTCGTELKNPKKSLTKEGNKAMGCAQTFQSEDLLKLQQCNHSETELQGFDVSANVKEIGLCHRPKTRTPKRERKKGLKRKVTFRCDVCEREFARPSSLKSHMITHTREKKHHCSHCGKIFTLFSSLNRHLRIHSGVKPHKCDICDLSFTSKGTVKRHRQTHYKEKPFQCKICLKPFARTTTLRDHMRIHNGDISFQCDECGKIFGRDALLSQHKISHSKEKNFSCEICQKMFQSKGLMKRHMVVHTGEKPFICPICGDSFSERSTLTNHARIHTGNRKPFPCMKCKKAFANKGTLKRHNRHFHSDLENANCK